MVVMTPIRQTNGSPPSQAKIPDSAVDLKPSVTDPSPRQQSNDLPNISTSTTMTAHQDLTKSSAVSSSAAGGVENRFVAESSIDEDTVEEVIIMDQSHHNNGALTDESFHLVTPAKPDSVSTLGGMTFLHDSNATMEEVVTVAVEDAIKRPITDDFYSTRRAITEVDEETSASKSPSCSTLQSSTTKSFSHRRIVKVRTVEENKDDDDSETTVSSEEGEQQEPSDEGDAPKSATIIMNASSNLQDIIVDEACGSALMPTVTPSSTGDEEDLQQSFSFDDENLIIEQDSGEQEELEQSVDWGESCSFDEVTMEDSQDFEDTRNSCRSLLSKEDRGQNELERSRGVTTFWGREEELAKLQKALSSMMNDLSANDQRVFWISGVEVGIGKTALVNEFCRRIPEGPIVCRGRCNQDLVLSPFEGIMSCFGDLLDVLLSKEMIGQWRSQIREELGDDIYLLALLLPSLAIILDTNDQNLVLNDDNQGRDLFLPIKRGLGRLLSVVCSKEVVVFAIDDMQWIDDDSLRLLESLLTPRTHLHFMFLGCHRRIKISHPVSRLKSKVMPEVATDFRLEILDSQDTINLISHYLNNSKTRAGSQQKQIRQSVQIPSDFRANFSGNPLHSIQLLHFLAETQAFHVSEERLVFDSSIKAPSNSEQVISERVRKLSKEETLVLQSAALLGTHTFHSQLVSVACRVLLESNEGTIAISPEKIDGLMTVLQKQMFLRRFADGIYAFESELVQQAATAKFLTSSKPRTRLHTLLAMALLQTRSNDAYDKFQEATETLNSLIAHHFSKGVSLIDTAEDKATVTNLCCQVAEDVMSRASYALGAKMLEIAMQTMETTTRWKENYKKSLKIHLALSNCNYHCGNHDKARPLANALISNARTARDKVGGFRILASIFRAKGQYDLSKNVLLKALGEIWNEPLSSLQVDEKLSTVRGLVHSKSDTDLLIMDEMTHKKTRAKMPFLMELAEISGICHDFRLQDLASLRIVELTLRYGSYEQNFTGLAFALCGVCLGRRRLHGEAFRYGNLAETLCHFQSTFGRQAVTHHHYLLRFWKKSAQESSNILLRVCKESLKDDDMVNISTQLGAYLATVLVAGQSLAMEDALIDEYLELAKQTNLSDSWIVLFPYNLIMKLKGGESGKLQEVSASGTKAVQYEIFFQMIFAVFFQDMDSAVALCSKLSIRPNGLYIPFGAFFEGMISAYQIQHSPAKEKSTHQKKATNLLELLSSWTTKGVPDVSCMANVLRIEISIANEIQVSQNKAAILFDAAIESALGIFPIAALACERAGLYFKSKGDENSASRFMTRSHSLYQRWGANAKVQQLVATHEYLVKADSEDMANFDDRSFVSKSVAIPTIHASAPDLIDLSDDIYPANVCHVSGNQGVQDFSQSIRSEWPPQPNGGLQPAHDRRSPFQRVSSDRAMGSSAPVGGRRAAFQRVASERVTFTQHGPSAPHAWPSQQNQEGLFLNHPSGQHFYPQAHQAPPGLQPPAQFFGMQQNGNLAQHHFYQQSQQPPNVNQQYREYPYPSQNYSHHTSQLPNQNPFPFQYQRAAAPVYQIQQHPHVIPQSLTQAQDNSIVAHKVADPTEMDPQIDSAPKGTPSSFVPSSPKKKGKRKPVRAQSIPGKMHNNEVTAPGSVSIEISLNEKQKLKKVGTWAELKEDLHPKSFLKDMNFGRKKKVNESKAGDDEANGNLKTRSKSPGMKKERPSLSSLPTWAVRSWSSGRRTSNLDGEEKAPALRRRTKTKEEDAKSNAPKSPKKKKHGKAIKGLSDSLQGPSASKEKKGSAKEPATDEQNLLASDLLKVLDSPKKKKEIVKKSSTAGLDVPSSPKKKPKDGPSTKITVEVSQQHEKTKEKAAAEEATGLNSHESKAPNKKKGVSKNESSLAKDVTDTPASISSASSPKKNGVGAAIEPSSLKKKLAKKKTNGGVKSSQDGSIAKQETSDRSIPADDTVGAENANLKAENPPSKKKSVLKVGDGVARKEATKNDNSTKSIKNKKKEPKKHEKEASKGANVEETGNATKKTKKANKQRAE